MDIERFHTRDQYLCKFIGTEEIVYIRKELKSQRICLEQPPPPPEKTKVGVDRVLKGFLYSHWSITVLISPSLL